MGKGIHVGDEGTIIQVTIVDEDENAIDISGSTVRTFRFEDPEEVTMDQTATYVTDGTDGKLQYVIQAGDLDVDGTWKLQVILTFASAKNYSSTIEFIVYPNLTTPTP